MAATSMATLCADALVHLCELSCTGRSDTPQEAPVLP